MNRSFSKLFVLVLVVVVVACNEDEPIAVDPAVLITPAEVINRFADLDSEGTLVVNYFIDKTTYRLILENDDTVKIISSIIEKFQPKPSDWSTLIQFTDGSTAQAPFLGNNLPITSDSVLVNPSGYGPLSAMVKVSLPVKGKFKLRVVGKNGALSDISHTFSDFQKVHRLDVFGLYSNFENTIELTYMNSEGKERIKEEIVISTGPLPSKMPVIDIDVAKRSSMEEGLTLISYRGLGAPFMPFIMDSFGDIRWYLNYSLHPDLKLLSFECGLEQLKNGNLYFGNVGTHKIYEVDFHGNIINSWGMEGYTFHHNVIEKPNGNLIVTVSKNDSKHLNGKPTINDYVIEINRATGAIVTEWDLKRSLDENRTEWANALSNPTVNWIHNNGIIYDETDNSIVITGRDQGLMKLSATNQVKWILSTHGGWGTSRDGVDLKTKLLRPIDQNNALITDADVLNGNVNHPDFEWSWYPHGPMVMPNGNIMVFDNGDKRNFTGAELYSRGVEYQINLENMTIKQVWQYGKERGIKAYSRIQGDVDFFPGTNNVLITPGWNVDNDGKFGGKVIEVDYQTREVIFEARITPPSGPQTLHRSERLKFYR
jgi:arylsulfate sulfotransferase